MKLLVCGFDGLDAMVTKENVVHMTEFYEYWKQAFKGMMWSKKKVTGISWTSIYTGVHEEKHGITDMWGRAINDSKDFTTTPAKYSWEMLNDAGLTTGIFNMPVTYPPKSVSGWMVSGFPTPTDSENITFPKALSKYLPDDYIVDVVNDKCAEEPHPNEWINESKKETAEDFIEYNEKVEMERLDVLEDILNDNPVDVLYFQSPIVDRILHVHGINTITDVSTYQAVSRIFDRVARITEAERIHVCSDHGGRENQHTHHATWFMWGKDIKSGWLLPYEKPRANEVDIAPTDLFWLDIPPPAGADFDGEIIYQAFDRKSDGDERDIEKQLEALGYL